MSRGDEPRTVVVKAQFSVDGVTDPSLSFLDDRVLVSHFDDCRAAYRDQEVNWVAMVAMVVVVLLGVSSLAGLCIYRHHRAANEDQMDLVGNMSQSSPQPYNLTTPEQRYKQMKAAGLFFEQNR